MEKKQPTKAKDNPADPEFNSGIAYLYTVRRLLDNAHDKMVEEDLPAVYNILKQLKIEGYPRLPETYEKNVADDEKKADYHMFNYSPEDETSNHNLKRAIYSWFLSLNLYFHRAKLIMPDKASEKEATFV